MRLGLEHPEALASLALIAAAALLLRKSRRNRRRLERFFDVEVSRLNSLMEAARLAALALLAVAAAMPYVEYTVRRKVPLERVGELSGKGVLHVVVLDVSRSMTYPLGPGTRFDAAREVLKRYLSSLPGGDRVHLAVFSSSARPVCQGAPSECLEALGRVEAGERYTAVGDALLYAASVARASALAPVIVLVSDGASNYGSDPVQVAEALRGEGLPAVLVAVGDRGVLPRVAEALGARLFTVDEFTAAAAGSLAERAAAEARYSGLAARGEAYVEEVRRSHVPAQLLLAAALALLASALLDGA